MTWLFDDLVTKAFQFTNICLIYQQFDQLYFNTYLQTQGGSDAKPVTN